MRGHEGGDGTPQDHGTRRFATATDSVAAEMFRAMTRTVLFHHTAASSSMNRVDDTCDACAKSPARAPFTVTSINDVTPGARLGRSQDCDHSDCVNASTDMSRARNYHPAGTARPGSELNGAYRYQALPSLAHGPFNEPSTPTTLSLITGLQCRINA